MWAVVSDIHGNLEALEAVLADAIAHKVEGVICLGDSVGYGPDPLECVKVSMSWPVVLQGNFEAAALSEGDLSWGASAAKRSVLWVRSLLQEQIQPSPIRAYLSERPRTYKRNGVGFVHGTLHNPLHEYVFPEDVYNPRKMERIFVLVERHCFHGHTHVPGVLTQSLPEGVYQFYAPDEIDYVHVLDGRKTLINVGSVGQPRDGDWRACYVLLDGETVHYRRVEYDVETTVKKIHATAELENFLGERLREGR
jgi:predicted phosphodiesterase